MKRLANSKFGLPNHIHGLIEIEQNPSKEETHSNNRNSDRRRVPGRPINQRNTRSLINPHYSYFFLCMNNNVG